MGIVFCIARIRMACGDGRSFEEIDMTVSMGKKYVTRNGKYDAKVVYIHDKGQYPVVVVITDIINNKGEICVYKLRSNGRTYTTSAEDGLDLIEVPEETQDGWIKFDAANDEVPFLHMHDMIEVKYINGIDLSSPVPAWSVDFDTLRDPVTAYRLVKKAEQPEKKSLPIEVFVDVAEAAERKVLYGNHGLQRHQVANTAREAAVRAVLELAGVNHEIKR
jgi:hypothetical protein